MVTGVRYFNTTNANFVDANGVVTEAAGAAITDIAGLLVEEESTNLVSYSNDIQQGAWSANNATRHDYESFTPTVSGGRVYYWLSPTVEGTSYTVSFWAKSAGNLDLQIYHLNSATGTQTPVTITGDYAYYSLTVLGRIGGGSIEFGLRDINTSGFGTIYVKDFQVEQKPYATSFIPTSGAAATRLADDADTEWPTGLVNGFLLTCEWIPQVIVPCTLLESGNVKISWAANVVTVAKGAITATAPLTPVQGTTYSIKGRIDKLSGVDVWVDDVKGTGNSDVTDAAPSTVLSIGSDE